MPAYISEVMSFGFLGKWWNSEKNVRERIVRKLNSSIKRWSKKHKAFKAEMYSSLRHDSDIIFWLASEKPEDILEAKNLIGRTLAGFAIAKNGFLSVYDMKNKVARSHAAWKYFVAYPMSKSPEWYLLDDKEAKRIVSEHVKIAVNSKSNNGIISYTTKSFGIGDYEFVVIYELPSLHDWVKVTEELRRAEARKWITKESPILVGIKGFEA